MLKDIKAWVPKVNEILAEIPVLRHRIGALEGDIKSLLAECSAKNRELEKELRAVWKLIGNRPDDKG